MKKLFSVVCLFFFTLFLHANNPLGHIVVLGDPHIPGKKLEAKQNVLKTINQWQDVSFVVAIGDLCSQTGTHEEYDMVKNYFSNLFHPLLPITGNHDFIYEDALDENGKLKHAPVKIQKEKLETFRTLFSLPNLFYTVEKEPYLFIFLSADTSEYLSGLSKEQLSWFENILKVNRQKPTIVFFHAPLNGTLETYRHWVNTPSFVAQPIEKIKVLIEENPQLFLWVSGHTHTSAVERSFASEINVYEKRVTNIHNSDMNKETIWTNSLFLYSDKIVVKTYNHTKHLWEEALERTFIKPTF